MMKILILGCDGMLGHQLVATLRETHEVAGTVRQREGDYGQCRALLPEVLYAGINVTNFPEVAHAVESYAPDAVVNAVGIVKQRKEAKVAIESIEVNALLPHRLAELCVRRGSRLIHFSTDCVFSGETGSYSDDAPHDARDLYGRSKSLGEVCGPGVITLRTSIIGLEISRKAGLIEWFLAQSGEIRGYTGAIFSGLTTLEMSRIVKSLLTLDDPPEGIYNVSSAPIDKFSLLEGLGARLGLDTIILPDRDFKCDRSLDSGRFRSRFGYLPPSWNEMLDELSANIRERSV